MRKLGVAAASAALVGTIAAVMPTGIAGADVSGAPLPSPIGGLCTTDAQAPCWRATSAFDIDMATTRPALPEVSGNKLFLNSATEMETGNAVWWNEMVPITGQSIEVSFNAYIDEGFQTQPIVAHGEGLTFALVEADASLLSNHNHPAPVPFDVDEAQYGYGSTGLAFSGFDGNDTTPTGGVNNVAGDKNLALALLTSNDDADLGGDEEHNVSRVGLLKGSATGVNPKVRTGRWYTGATASVENNIYGGRAVPVTLGLYPKAGVPNTWVAHVTVDGIPKVDTEVQLPPAVFMGFTEGTHDLPQRHAISDVKVAFGTFVPPPPPPPPPPPGLSLGAPYNAVPPDRILDTRISGGPIGPGGIRSVKVTGTKGVPEGAGAVVMNVTAAQPTAPGYITVYPTGTQRPTASSLNFVAGQDIANLVTAKVGTNGQVDIYNYDGDTQVLFDVVGWFPASLSSAAETLAAQAGEGGQFVPLVPDRLLDTRHGIGAPTAPLQANSALDLQVTGRGGVPATGVAAVVMNLTGTNTTAPGYLTAWPTGSQRQTTSNLNFVADQSVPNLAVVPVGAGGKVSIYNYAGATDVLADVVGYYTAPGVTVPGGGLFHAMAPDRFLDTRLTGGTLGTDGSLGLPVTGRAGIPAEAVGVVMNVTATNTTEPGFLTVFPAGAARPITSNLNFVPGQSVPNLVMGKIGTGGVVSIYNYAGSTDVVVDVVGWYGPT